MGKLPNGRKDEITPWLEAFVNARKWCEGIRSKSFIELYY